MRQQRIRMESLEQREKRARESVPAEDFLAYRYIPTPHGFVVRAITKSSLGIKNEEETDAVRPVRTKKT